MTETTTPKQEPKYWWLQVLTSSWTKALFAVVVITLLLTYKRIDFSSLRDTATRWPWLVLAFLLMLPPYPIVSLRFWIVLRNQHIDVPFRDALHWTMVGSFFDVIMPSSSGGDLIKAAYVVRALGAGLRTKAVMAVVFDRVLGLLGLFILAGMTSALGWQVVKGVPGGAKLVGFIVIVCLGTLLTFYVLGDQRLNQSKLARRVFDRLPAGRRIEAMLQSFNHLRSEEGALSKVLALSVLNHIFWCASLLCITRAFGQHTQAVLGFVVFPLAIFSNVFGFAGGFGVGTAAFDVIFSRLLLIPVGASIGIVFQVLSLLSRLTGLPFYLSGKRDAHLAEDAFQDTKNGSHPPANSRTDEGLGR